jgi:MFS family permease
MEEAFVAYEVTPRSPSVVRRYLRGVKEFHPNAKYYLWCAFITAIARSIFQVAFNLFVYELGYRQDFIGYLNGIPSLAMLFFALPASVAVNRVGYKKPAVIGIILSIVGLLGISLADSKMLLVVFRFLDGIGATFIWAVGVPLLMRYSTEDNRVFLFSVNSALQMGSAFLGSIIGGVIPEIAGRIAAVPPKGVLPLRVTLLASVLFIVISIIPTILMTEERRHKRRQASYSALVVALPRDKKDLVVFAKILFPATLTSFGAGAMVPFFQLFFSLRFNMSTASIGLIFAFSGIVSAVVTLAAPVLAKKMGKVKLIAATQLASIPFLLTLAHSLNPRAVVASYYLRHSFMNMCGPVETTFFLEQVREEQRATLHSLRGVLDSLMRGGLAPFASGILQVKGGFPLAFSMTAVCYFVSVLVFYGFFKSAENGSEAH